MDLTKNNVGKTLQSDGATTKLVSGRQGGGGIMANVLQSMLQPGKKLQQNQRRGLVTMTTTIFAISSESQPPAPDTSRSHRWK